jgi:hypothetical protein
MTDLSSSHSALLADYSSADDGCCSSLLDTPLDTISFFDLPPTTEPEPVDPSRFRLTVAQNKALDTLTSDATHCALGGGARSGKSALLIICIITRAMKCPYSRHAVFRFRLNALISSIVADTLPKMMRLAFPGLWEKCKMNRQDNFLTLPNQSEIWFVGLDDKDRTEKILGMEFATLYFNECSQIPYTSVVIALTRLAQKTSSLTLKAYYDFNPPSKVHWTYLMFILNKNPENKRDLKHPTDYKFYLINPMDNIDNLDAKYINMLDSLNEKARNRFLLGKFADESDGQLFTEEVIAVQRVLGRQSEIPEFLRVVISVDPSGCSGPEDKRSDEVGITIGALGIDGKAYLLADLSGKHSPEQWSKIVNDAYARHNADIVVGESNFGGDMVRAVLQANNPDLPYKEVTASRGKVVRAEPFSTLYQRGKVHHVGYYAELEDQLCGMTTAGYQGLRSPDRADAWIWALAELFPSMTQSKKSEDWTPPVKKTYTRKASKYDRR